ncbi:hypothetical protein BB559_000968 [Furculomyces boomerangus]|uniref:Uncharacterized protein n=1 Tax=Furculomyces boomerangus TaxID=61424 RepID=A0A2T9Z3I0_9FUNG|nr:hypothetical protein BB559_000968 [Furculomyces boomerangus]
MINNNSFDEQYDNVYVSDITNISYTNTQPQNNESKNQLNQFNTYELSQGTPAESLYTDQSVINNYLQNSPNRLRIFDTRLINDISSQNLSHSFINNNQYQNQNFSNLLPLPNLQNTHDNRLLIEYLNSMQNSSIHNFTSSTLLRNNSAPYINDYTHNKSSANFSQISDVNPKTINNQFQENTLNPPTNIFQNDETNINIDCSAINHSFFNEAEQNIQNSQMYPNERYNPTFVNNLYSSQKPTFSSFQTNIQSSNALMNHQINDIYLNSAFNPLSNLLMPNINIFQSQRFAQNPISIPQNKVQTHNPYIGADNVSFLPIAESANTQTNNSLNSICSSGNLTTTTENEKNGSQKPPSNEFLNTDIINSQIFREYKLSSDLDSLHVDTGLTNPNNETLSNSYYTKTINKNQELSISSSMSQITHNLNDAFGNHSTVSIIPNSVNEYAPNTNKTENIGMDLVEDEIQPSTAQIKNTPIDLERSFSQPLHGKDIENTLNQLPTNHTDFLFYTQPSNLLEQSTKFEHKTGFGGMKDNLSISTNNKVDKIFTIENNAPKAKKFKKEDKKKSKTHPCLKIKSPNKNAMKNDNKSQKHTFHSNLSTTETLVNSNAKESAIKSTSDYLSDRFIDTNHLEYKIRSNHAFITHALESKYNTKSKDFLICSKSLDGYFLQSKDLKYVSISKYINSSLSIPKSLTKNENLNMKLTRSNAKLGNSTHTENMSLEYTNDNNGTCKDITSPNPLNTTSNPSTNICSYIKKYNPEYLPINHQEFISVFGDDNITFSISRISKLNTENSLYKNSILYKNSLCKFPEKDLAVVIRIKKCKLYKSNKEEYQRTIITSISEDFEKILSFKNEKLANKSVLEILSTMSKRKLINLKNKNFILEINQKENTGSHSQTQITDLENKTSFNSDIKIADYCKDNRHQNQLISKDLNGIFGDILFENFSTRVQGSMVESGDYTCKPVKRKNKSKKDLFIESKVGYNYHKKKAQDKNEKQKKETEPDEDDSFPTFKLDNSKDRKNGGSIQLSDQSLGLGLQANMETKNDQQSENDKLDNNNSNQSNEKLKKQRKSFSNPGVVFVYLQKETAVEASKYNLEGTMLYIDSKDIANQGESSKSKRKSSKSDKACSNESGVDNNYFNQSVQNSAYDRKNSIKNSNWDRFVSLSENQLKFGQNSTKTNIKKKKILKSRITSIPSKMQLETIKQGSACLFNEDTSTIQNNLKTTRSTSLSIPPVFSQIHQNPNSPTIKPGLKKVQSHYCVSNSQLSDDAISQLKTIDNHDSKKKKLNMDTFSDYISHLQNIQTTQESCSMMIQNDNNYNYQNSAFTSTNFNMGLNFTQAESNIFNHEYNNNSFVQSNNNNDLNNQYRSFSYPIPTMDHENQKGHRILENHSLFQNHVLNQTQSLSQTNVQIEPNSSYISLADLDMLLVGEEDLFSKSNINSL